MDAVTSFSEREKLRLVRKILSARGKTLSEDIRRAKAIRQNRICRRCRWRRDGTQACCLPCCMKKAVGSICKKEEV